MNRAIMVMFFATTAVVAGCDDKSQGASPSPSGGAAVASVQDADLATAADFSDEAEKAVTATNYKQELDALEKELSREP